mmetsp:Transcript_7874/g.17234  ORF Transcript_7874/g.17234 Transcript_7874/m.17234 type:complete len:209 (+) Transcript_7874:960-1586(+)
MPAKLAQLGGGVGHLGAAVRRVRPAGGDHLAERRDGGRQAVERGTLAGGGEHRGHALALGSGEGNLPVEELPEQEAEGVDVALLVVRHAGHAAAADHLGSHVARRADASGVHPPSRVERRLGDDLHLEARDAEVGNLGVEQPVEEHVGGLDVAVDDVVAVEVGDARRRLVRDAQEERDVEVPARLPVQQLVDGAHLEVLHDHRHPAVE